ncbi:MAG: helix-turn-helix domain-containing protein [Clostridia bacterium]|nr:helix-turn-helix domain-containing protein [Clostridia bacterium]
MLQQNLELLNCEQVAQMLGVKIGTIYVWICKKQLPQSIYRKLGRKPVFIKSEIEKWILDGAEMVRG